jgi:hypothetical protein
MENFGIFYDHLEHFMAILCNLWPFCIDCGHMVYFSPFWSVVPRKIWQSCLHQCFSHQLLTSAIFAMEQVFLGKFFSTLDRP